MTHFGHSHECGMGCAPLWTILTSLPNRSGLQFDFPVRAAEELLPGLAPLARRHMSKRLPRRLPRNRPELHAGLLGRPVRLPLVARHAGQDAVLPRRDAPLGPGMDVLDRERLRARL